MKKLALVMLAGSAIAVLVTGCSKDNTVAEINGQKITYKEFVQDIGTSQSASQAATKALSALFERRLVLDLAKKKGVPPTDEQVNRRLDFLKKSQDLEEQLAQQGLTMDDVKRQIKVQEASSNLAIQLTKGKVKQEDVDKQYDNNEWVYNGEEGVKSEVAIFRDKATADRADAEIKKGATLEKALAAADPMAAMYGGGRVQKAIIRRNDARLPADVIDAAFDTPIGKVTAPVKLGGAPGKENFVILHVMSKVPSFKVSEKDAKTLLKEDLALQKATGAGDRAANGGDLKKLIDTAKKNAKITITEPSLKKAEKEFRNPEPPPGMPGMQ